MLTLNSPCRPEADDYVEVSSGNKIKLISLLSSEWLTY